MILAILLAASASVSLLEGSATRTHGSESQPLAAGAEVGQGDTIATAASSRLELKFSDASVLRIGPSAKVTLTEAHFGNGERKLSAKLVLGDLWAKVTTKLQGDQKFTVETENAVAGVRGTTFRVGAQSDKSVVVRVYDGAVGVQSAQRAAAPGERREVAGPQEVTREQWEKIVGKQMQIVIAADGAPGEPTSFTSDSDDAFARWNESRDQK